MFRAMFSPIIRSTWLYLQHLVMFNNVAAAGVMDGLEQSSTPSMTPASSDIGKHYKML